MTQEIQSTKEMGLEYLGPGDKGSRLRDGKSDSSSTRNSSCSSSLASSSCDKEARLSVIELTTLRTTPGGGRGGEETPGEEEGRCVMKEDVTTSLALRCGAEKECEEATSRRLAHSIPNRTPPPLTFTNTSSTTNTITNTILNANGKKRRRDLWIPSKGCVGMRDCGSYFHSMLRGSSWGGLRVGLLGGGDNSLSNGTSGWGPPPGAATGASGGWGTAPSAPNPIASATWGNPNPSTSQMNSDDNSKSSAVIGPNPSSSPPGGGTSWAAAAGKGLPPSDASSVIPPASSSSANSAAASNNGNGCPSTTKQQLEQLNSVREALFSQDGWGGSFVKQDTSWDTSVIGAFSGDTLQHKDSNNTFSTHNGRRNDGTEIWKVNLSGQPPAPKPQPSNPWGHTPQNPTDFKNWGEDDETHDVPPSSRNNINDPLWRGPRGTDPSAPQPPTHHHHQQPNGPSNQFGSSKDDWHNNGPSVGPSNNWNDPRRDPSQNQPQAMASHPGQQQPPGRSDNSGPGWNSSAPPIRQVMNQWGSSNNPTNNGAPGSNFIRAAGGGWGATDGDSPTLSRRPVSHGGMDDGGTSLWGKIPPGPPVGGDRHERNNSNWQDMPTPTPTRAGPPGPPNRLSMPSAPPVKDSSPWGGPIGHRISGGWNDEPPMKPSGWGTPDVIDPMKQRDNGWGGTDQWQNRAAGPPRQSQIRVSPNWDEATNDSSPTGWGSGQIKPRGSHLTKEFIWSSKQFRMLVEMGFDKNDIETALRRSHLNLEDAMDFLRYNNSVSRGGNDGLFNDPGSFDPMRGRFPPGQMFNYSNNAMDHSNTPGYASNFMIHNSNKLMNNGSSSIPPSNGPPRHPPQANNNQQPPSAQQLRILVQQIQMAVQAGHLNPQILNQPLAPQTLILLNQLLQQIKNLQALQLAHSQKSVNPGALLVNITKTKQMILNLQNQISAQQANYLKQQQQQQTPSSHLGPDSPATLSGMSTMQDMFAGLGLNNGPIDSSSNNGSRLAQWKLTEDSFTKAPGGSSKLASSSNLLLDDGPWSNSAPGGWPEKQQEPPSSSSASNPSGAINGLDHFGISEFEPGKPWKSPGLKNPDDDPNLTPGSVAPSVLQMDVKVSAAASSVENNTLGLTTPTWTYSNKSENNAPKTSETWGQPQSSSLTPMGQDLWGKAGRSGPPGLVTSASNGIDKNWSAANSDGPTWLLLKNLTAQIDGATLKTLCLQHGPLKHFHLYLNHNLALVNYNSSREAAKAQKALNNCLLGNTTIMATSATDGEVSQILQQQQQQQQQGNGSTNSGANNSNTATASDNGNRGSTPSSSTGDMWGPIKSVAATSRAGGESGSVWGNPLGSTADDQHRILLPGDLGI